MPTIQVNHKKAVREYLLALTETTGPVPHAMRRDQEWYQNEIDKINARYAESDDVMEKLHFAAKIVELEAKAQAKHDWDEARVDPAKYEDAFVESAAIYATARKVSYEAFRACGVPAAVLKRAGVPHYKDLV